jgi:hypothetical protein
MSSQQMRFRQLQEEKLLLRFTRQFGTGMAGISANIQTAKR